MKSINSQILTTVLIAGSLIMIGCGSNKITAGSSESAAVTDFSSRVPVNSTSQKPLAVCNRGSNGQLSVDLRQFEDGFGAARNDYVRAKVRSVPSELTNSSYYLAFYRWKANSQGQAYMDNDALNVRVESLSSQFFAPVSGYSENLTWEAMQGIAEKANNSVTTPSEFFTKFSLTVDIRDPLAEYDAIKVVLYNGSEVVSELDMLLPTFYADPHDYRLEPSGSARAQSLQSIHPFASMVGQSWSANHYTTEANKFCF
jgi:hypothetical protein